MLWSENQLNLYVLSIILSQCPIELSLEGLVSSTFLHVFSCDSSSLSLLEVKCAEM